MKNNIKSESYTHMYLMGYSPIITHLQTNIPCAYPMNQLTKQYIKNSKETIIGNTIHKFYI